MLLILDGSFIFLLIILKIFEFRKTKFDLDIMKYVGAVHGSGLIRESWQIRHKAR